MRKLTKSGFQHSINITLARDLSLPNLSSDGSRICFQSYRKAYELPRAKLCTYKWQNKPVAHGMFRIHPSYRPTLHFPMKFYFMKFSEQD